jgi:hypothetical protein
MKLHDFGLWFTPDRREWFQRLPEGDIDYAVCCDGHYIGYQNGVTFIFNRYLGGSWGFAEFESKFTYVSRVGYMIGRSVEPGDFKLVLKAIPRVEL